MWSNPAMPNQLDPKIVLRPIAEDDAAELRRIHSTPGVSRWWEMPEDDFPLGDDPGATRFVIDVDGRVGGLIQYGEETEPKYRHASIDLFVDPEIHGRGIGTAAIEKLVTVLIAERRHHRITIDPATDNAAAIRCYEKAGFSRVGVMRKAERNVDARGWHDALMMELVVETRPR